MNEEYSVGFFYSAIRNLKSAMYRVSIAPAIGGTRIAFAYRYSTRAVESRRRRSFRLAEIHTTPFESIKAPSKWRRLR